GLGRARQPRGRAGSGRDPEELPVPARGGRPGRARLRSRAGPGAVRAALAGGVVMLFKIDENLPTSVAELLRTAGHDGDLACSPGVLSSRAGTRVPRASTAPPSGPRCTRAGARPRSARPPRSRSP